jgi:hypothetical protein
MILATLDTIKTAMIGQLRTQRADVGGPFKTVDNFAGDISQRGGQDLVNAIFAMAPGALIASAGETYEVGGRTGAPQTLVRGSTGFVGTSTWHVYVISLALEDPSKLTEDGKTQLGIYSLTTRAIGSLAGLPIAGLYRSSSLDALDAKPFWWKSGRYVWLARFTARRWLKAAEIEDTSHPLRTVAGTVTSKANDESGAVDSLQLESE